MWKGLLFAVEVLGLSQGWEVCTAWVFCGEGSDVGSSSHSRAFLFSDGPQEGAELWQDDGFSSQHIF